MNTVFDALQFRTLRERLFAMHPAVEDVEREAATIEIRLAALESGSLARWFAERGQGLLGLEVSGRPTPVGGDAWVLAVANIDGDAIGFDLTDLSPEDDDALAVWLGDTTRPKTVHGGKNIRHMLTARGYTLSAVTFDTELAAYLCFPDQRTYDLGDLAQRHVHKELAGVAHGGGAQGVFDLDLGDAPEDSETRRLAVRAAAVVQVAEVLAGELADRGEGDLLTTLELPLSGVLAQMEQRGIAVDSDYLRGLDTFFGEGVAQAAQAAYEVIGREVNLGSPKQLQEVLFDQLDMPKTKKIKTGYTTDASALADLFVKTGHPFLELLLAHRDATRLRQTVEGLLKSIADDGRVHTTFQQTNAATGRLSSTEPNLQNIPIRTEAGRRIRRAFVVGAGYETLLTADYSQIEMRIMAHLSGDEGLIEAFRSGEDLHSYVGSRVFSVPTDKVTAAMRSKIKAMSYGLAYGLSSFGLSKQLAIEVGEAATLMEDYFDRFGGVRAYLAGIVDDARATGYTATILGRRRYLPDLTSDNRQRREMAERMALNAPIQGSAADIIKVAMLDVERQIADRGLRSRLLLQVHDELLLEVGHGEREELEALVRSSMGSAAELLVPLDVSVGIGANWHDAGH